MAKNNDKKAVFLYETKDVLSGTAFPLMLQMILSVTFIGMATAFSEDDLLLSIIMLCIGELFVGAAYFIFGRQSGITSVRKIVQNAKKREIGTSDKQALLCIGEYSAYKGFLIGFISCIPYIVFQIIQCAAPNSFCDFVLQYVFGWAALFLPAIAGSGVSKWYNFLLVLFPVTVHGVTYIIAAYREWAKQQKVAILQSHGEDDKKEDK